MAFVYADRVQESTTTTGTSDLTLAGAPTGRQTFDDGVGVGNETDICIEDEATGDWEVCRATLADATTLERGLLHASSTGSRINFAAGTKRVFCTLSAFQARAGIADVVVVSGTTHTPTLAHAGPHIRCTNAAGCAIEIPAEADVPFPIGATLIYEQADDGALAFAGDTGVTINVAATHLAATVDQFAVVQLRKVGSDEWTIYGNLEAA